MSPSHALSRRALLRMTLAASAGVAAAAYTWNARGELKTAGTGTYTYDAAGRRASKKIGTAALTSYVYAGNDPVNGTVRTGKSRLQG